MYSAEKKYLLDHIKGARGLKDESEKNNYHNQLCKPGSRCCKEKHAKCAAPAWVAAGKGHTPHKHLPSCPHSEAKRLWEVMMGRQIKG